MISRSKLLSVAALLAFSAGTAQAQISGNVVKIGILNDQSGTYADLAGPGSTLPSWVRWNGCALRIAATRALPFKSDQRRRGPFFYSDKGRGQQYKRCLSPLVNA